MEIGIKKSLFIYLHMLHVGYNVDKDTGEKIATSLATVHVSNKGIHIVPRG